MTQFFYGTFIGAAVVAALAAVALGSMPDGLAAVALGTLAGALRP